MPITVDCGENKHDLCTGTGRTAYLIPQESRGYDEPPFYCGCHCHHDGTGSPCEDPECPSVARRSGESTTDETGQSTVAATSEAIGDVQWPELREDG